MTSMNSVSDLAEMLRVVKDIFRYCPSCSKPLCDKPISDVLSAGFICDAGHAFFAPLKTVRPESHSEEFLDLRSARADPDEIAKDWLIRVDLRSHLNDSVAESLRLFLDMRAKGLDQDKQKELWQSWGKPIFCAKCGSIATATEGDGYSVGYQCEKKHFFGSRGVDVTFSKDPRLSDDSWLQLRADSWDPLYFMRGFVKSAEWKKKIAFQVQEILVQYLQGIESK